MLLLGRMAVLCIRSIVIDRVAWSLGLSITLVSPAKTAAPIDLPCGLWTRVVRTKDKFNRNRQVAPTCRRGEGTLRIRLNRPSVAAMQPYVGLL